MFPGQAVVYVNDLHANLNAHTLCAKESQFDNGQASEGRRQLNLIVM